MHDTASDFDPILYDWEAYDIGMDVNTTQATVMRVQEVMIPKDTYAQLSRETKMKLEFDL